MRRVLRFIFRGLIGVVALVGVLGALLGYLATRLFLRFRDCPAP